MRDDLSARFERVSRGRPVTVNGAPNHLLRRDFTVSHNSESDTYVVELTDAGRFEEAFRFLERWIARHAVMQDHLYEPPPPDHWDLRDEAFYWLLERHSDQFFADLEQAVARYSKYMEDEMHYVPRTGDIVIEWRVAALRSVLSHFAPVRAEVRAAILSPHTVDVLRAIGVLPSDKDELGKDAE